MRFNAQRLKFLIVAFTCILCEVILSSCGTSIHPQPTTWAEEMSLVQIRAREHNPEAVLLRGSGEDDSIYNANVTPKNYIDMMWTFVLPDATTFTVSTRHKDGFSTILNPYQGSVGTITPEEMKMLATSASNVHIAPQEALEIANPQGRLLLDQTNELISVVIGLRLYNQNQDQQATYPLWTVYYVTKSHSERLVRIDAMTGEITNIEDRQL